MRRRLLSGWTVLIVAATLGVVAAVVFYPGRRSLELDAYVLFLGALGLAAGVRMTREASPDVHGPSLADELADPLDVLPQRPVELERLEREVYLSLATSFHLYHRLRPLFREIAENRLQVRHGVDLDRRPEDARALLGDEAWAWLRSDCPEPRDRWAPGPPIAELTAVVDALERI